ncbi:recombinase family protein [Emcibacter sp.]|uniref:recombinase family protein n=1 Tax=Emcibacter sp. TaxID=1979954 RepID=UPI003B63E9AC
MKPKAVIYARYSTDLQREASINDQIRICEEFVEKHGWSLHERYFDKGISGASLSRPGIQQLLNDAREGQFDVIVSEALDRLSRDQADIATIYREMNFLGVKLYTLSEGEVDTIHIGLKGTMNALFLKDLKAKIHRGMRGRVETGKSGGGLGYGYNVIKKYDERGERITGDLEINAFEADVIKRIFKEYVAGKAPRTIARDLNKDGIPSPRGQEWGQSTINGNPARGSGILNNELYIGRRIWNRQKFLKNPITGKRVTRINPECEWIIDQLPELRIVDQKTWDKAKARQKSRMHPERSVQSGNPLASYKRPKYLFSGLLKCGYCGGGYTVKNKKQISCATVSNKGTCSNRIRIERRPLEKVILSSIKNQLMTPEAYAEFCEEYTQTLNESYNREKLLTAEKKKDLSTIEKDLERLIQAIKDGVPALSIKDQIIELENRKAELIEEIKSIKKPKPVLPPNLAIEYRNKLEALYETLNDESVRYETTEVIRSLVTRIELTPEDKATINISIKGDLASILNFAEGKEPHQNGSDFRYDNKLGVQLVAEEGLEPPTRGL